jgi:catechol 2,3-dioxygenase-like lactoylglutathione lyase family enzyme
MALSYLDHVNIRTARLSAMAAFYREVLGLEAGERPPFRFDGAWLYCGDKAAIHLVEVPQAPETGQPRIEHFAFRADGLAGFLKRLRDREIAYRISIVPGLELRQVNIFDPDGNHIEIAFPAEEQADLSDYPGGG